MMRYLRCKLSITEFRQNTMGIYLLRQRSHAGMILLQVHS